MRVGESVRASRKVHYARGFGRGLDSFPAGVEASSPASLRSLPESAGVLLSE